MTPARIAELLQPFLDTPHQSPKTPRHSEPRRRLGGEPDLLSPALLHNISTYIDILLRWNARVNLTAVRVPEEIVTRHFGESLFAARHLFPYTSHVGTALDDVKGTSQRGALQSGRAALQRREKDCKEEGPSGPEAIGQQPSDGTAVADLGSGAGFPGLPIKLWAPHISLTLIESNHKKATFLREVTRALTLTDVNIQNVRAETLPAGGFSVVTLRAVERFATILPAAAALLAPGGRLTLLIGSAQADPVTSTLPNLLWSTPEPIPLSLSRVLLIGQRSH